MDNKLRETTNSCVEIWWIVGDKQRENLVMWYKSRLPFDLNVMLNLPSIKPQVTVVQASCHLPTCILMRRLDCSLAKCPAHGWTVQWARLLRKQECSHSLARPSCFCLSTAWKSLINSRSPLTPTMNRGHSLWKLVSNHEDLFCLALFLQAALTFSKDIVSIPLAGAVAGSLRKLCKHIYTYEFSSEALVFSK